MKEEIRRNSLFYNNFRRFVCGPTLYILYNFIVEGKENLPGKGPAIILSKHQSWMDLFVICYISKIPLYYIAKQEIFENLFGDFQKGLLYQTGKILKIFLTRGLYWMGAIPLSRDNPRKTLSSFKYMEQLLEEREIIVIFPEGKFVKNAMGEIKPGLIKWLMKLQKKKKLTYPVVNIGLSYKKAFPRLKLTCRIAPITSYEHNDEKVIKKITETIRNLSNLTLGRARK